MSLTTSKTLKCEVIDLSTSLNSNASSMASDQY